MPEAFERLLPDLLSRLCRFYGGPDLDQCRALYAGTFFLPFEALADAHVSGALEEIRLFVGSHPSPEALFLALEAAYVRLFVSCRGGIAAPLYQSCYSHDGAPLMGPPAVRMQQRLADAGLVRATGAVEPPDHLAVELEYLYFLVVSGTTAFMHKAVLFARTELSAWIGPFKDRLARAPDARPYDAGAVLVSAVVGALAGNSPEV